MVEGIFSKLQYYLYYFINQNDSFKKIFMGFIKNEKILDMTNFLNKNVFRNSNFHQKRKF